MSDDSIFRDAGRRPTWTQVFFARYQPLKIWVVASAILSVVGAVIWCEPSAEMFTQARWVFWFVVAVIVSPMAGTVVLFIPGIIVTSPVYSLLEKRNGGPFVVGDIVMVLIGPYRGRVGQVYSTFQGDSLRVAIGLQEQKDLEDIFNPIELLRQDSLVADQIKAEEDT